MNDVRHDELEWEVKRHKDMALILAKQLNDKIDECTILQNQLNGTIDRKIFLQNEVSRLRDVIKDLHEQI